MELYLICLLLVGLCSAAPYYSSRSGSQQSSTGRYNGQNNAGGYNGQNNGGSHNGNNNVGGHNGNNNGGSYNGNNNDGGYNGNNNGGSEEIDWQAYVPGSLGKGSSSGSSGGGSSSGGRGIEPKYGYSWGSNEGDWNNFSQWMNRNSGSNWWSG